MRALALARSVARSRATWLFVAAWLASVAVLSVSTGGVPWDTILIGVAYLVLAGITVLITEPAPPAPATRAERPRLWLHVAIVLGFIALTGFGGLVFHEVVAPDASIPVWTPLVDALRSLGEDWFGNGGYVANPVAYFVVPLAVLLLAGARLRSLGFGRGHRVGRVLLLWAAIPVAYLAVAVATGQLTIGRVLTRLVSNTLQNGFFEEFLFRGVLQTRLRALLTPAWALALQALLFGVWHLGLGFTDTDHAGLLPAVASTIVHQAVLGLAFGVILERTRNLLVPSVAHVLANSMG